jgi:C-terminal processing protease CtpA/Prc
VRLATFNSNTTAAAQQAFEELSKQGVAGLVLDIRNNGGGLFPAGARAGRQHLKGVFAHEMEHVCCNAVSVMSADVLSSPC